MIHVPSFESTATVAARVALYAAVADETEALVALQLRVARRADWLARYGTLTRREDRALWLRAEQEVFEALGNARPALTLSECEAQAVCA